MAAEPRGVGGLRADQIKALWMTAGGEEGGRQPPRNGWARELVIDGGWVCAGGLAVGACGWG